MKTTHNIIYSDARNMEKIDSETIDLMITSPPYPMISMWDEMFVEQNPSIKELLSSGEGNAAFELMNKELDKVWKEVYRVLKPGGTACINIGDAVRTLNKNFALYSNHSRILSCCLEIGFQALPNILWRKQTNAPNKYMGSGMLPPGAYVTLEHEYILVLRKGTKREFKKPAEKLIRQKSSFFWEERNLWFSDIWEGLKGTGQKLTDERIRERSAAYPFKLAHRLVSMFSVKGDIILDPFLGTGTTTLAAMASGRNSIGVEIVPHFNDTVLERINDIKSFSNDLIKNRIEDHLSFVKEREEKKGKLGYENKVYNFPVMTRQELEIVFNELDEVKKTGESSFEVSYITHPNET